MTPIRHNHSDGDAVLDAVRDCVLAVGVRRTTMTDVARRAGVSRMTLYRRWPDVRSLVGDLIVQSFALSLRTMTDADDTELNGDAFLAELRGILERTLTP